MWTHGQATESRAERPTVRRGARPTAPCRACRVRGLSVCDALEVEELEALAALQSHQQIAANQAVCYEGDPADAVYTVAAGTLRLSKLLADGRRQVAGFLMPGDFLGLLDGDVHTCTAEAVDRAVLCRIERRGFDRLSERFPRLQRRLRACATQALTEAHEHILMLGQRTPREKLACFLLRLNDRLGSAAGTPDDTLVLPMKRADIADYLGMTIETLSRTFTAMRRDGMIELPRPELVVFRDLDGLAELAA